MNEVEARGLLRTYDYEDLREMGRCEGYLEAIEKAKGMARALFEFANHSHIGVEDGDWCAHCRAQKALAKWEAEK